MNFNFNPTTVKLTGTLYENCVDTNYIGLGSLKDEVYDWLDENCSESFLDQFHVSHEYTKAGYTYNIRFDYEEHATLFIMRWS